VVNQKVLNFLSNTGLVQPNLLMKKIIFKYGYFNLLFPFKIRVCGELKISANTIILLLS